MRKVETKRKLLGLAVYSHVENKLGVQARKDILKYKFEILNKDREIPSDKQYLYRCFFFDKTSLSKLVEGKSISLKKNLEFSSWTLSKNSAKQFANLMGEYHSGKIPIIIRKKIIPKLVFLNVNSILKSVGLINEEYSWEKEILVLNEGIYLSISKKDIVQ